MDPVFYMLLGALATPMVYLVVDFRRTFFPKRDTQTVLSSSGVMFPATAHRPEIMQRFLSFGATSKRDPNAPTGGFMFGAMLPEACDRCAAEDCIGECEEED